MRVEAHEPEVRRGAHRVDRAGGEPVVEAESELRVELSGLDVRVGVGPDAGGDADQDVLRLREQGVEPLDLVERVHDHVPDPRLDRELQLGGGLVVPVDVDSRGVAPGPDRHVQLAARGDVDREPLVGEQPVDRADRRRLGRVDHLEVVAVGAERIEVSASAGAQVVLGVDVRGRAELGGELGDVAPADLQVPALVDAASQRIDGRALDGVACGFRRPSAARVVCVGAHRAGHYPRHETSGIPGLTPRTLPSPEQPTLRGEHEGRPFWLWLPPSRRRGSGVAPPASSPERPWPGMLILHGAGSRKENHADFARMCAAGGWAALAYDQRGHGDATDEMGPAALGDVTRMARFLGEVDGVDGRRICARGSSMGGFMAIHARRDLGRDRRRDRHLSGGRGASASRVARATTWISGQGRKPAARCRRGSRSTTSARRRG